MKAILGCSIILFATATIRAPAAVAQSAEGEVIAVVNQLIDALNRGDSALARTTFHPKARLITFDSRNPAARIDSSAEGFIQSLSRPRNEKIEERLSNVKTLIDGGLASVWADYKLFVGPRLNHCGVDHFLLVKESGSWKIIELADTRRREGC